MVPAQKPHRQLLGGRIRGEIASILQNRASTAHKTSCRQNESTAVFCMQNRTQISQNKLEIYKKYFANRAFGCNLI